MDEENERADRRTEGNDEPIRRFLFSHMQKRIKIIPLHLFINLNLKGKLLLPKQSLEEGTINSLAGGGIKGLSLRLETYGFA